MLQDKCATPHSAHGQESQGLISELNRTQHNHNPTSNGHENGTLSKVAQSAPQSLWATTRHKFNAFILLYIFQVFTALIESEFFVKKQTQKLEFTGNRYIGYIHAPYHFRSGSAFAWS